MAAEDVRIVRIVQKAKSGDAKSKKELGTLTAYRDTLLAGKNARSLQVDAEDKKAIEDLLLLTDKPVIYVANVDEKSIHTGNQHVEALRKSVKQEGAEVVLVCAAIEAQIAELESEEDRKVFLDEYGLKESGLSRLIRAAYDLLDLITYFTAGEKEVRAWTIHKGWKAPAAAGVIHTDFEKGFIRAEVIKISDYQKYKSEAGCREAGKLAVEGKEYTVEDGDVMHFRFNL